MNISLRQGHTVVELQLWPPVWYIRSSSVQPSETWKVLPGPHLKPKDCETLGVELRNNALTQLSWQFSAGQGGELLPWIIAHLPFCWSCETIS